MLRVSSLTLSDLSKSSVDEISALASYQGLQELLSHENSGAVQIIILRIKSTGRNIESGVKTSLCVLRQYSFSVNHESELSEGIWVVYV